MGRIFETRKATMFARWNKMAKAFTRVAKDIAIAVKTGGPDPHTNAALRRAIQNARGLNMPKDKVEGAIKRASGQLASAAPSAARPTARPDAVFVPAMTAAMMLPTAIDIEWAVLPQTCATNSVIISLRRLGTTLRGLIVRPV